MKYLLILTIGFCLLLTSVPAMADQAEDEAAIRKLVQQEVAAANNHDAKGRFAPCAEDYENWSGTRKGRMANEKFLTEYYAGRGKNSQVEEEEISIIFVAPEVAIYKGRGVESNVVDKDGKTLPPQEYLVAAVFVKRNGGWLEVATFDRPIEE